MTPFRVMTWNVENLFRPAPSAPERERSLYDRKLALLAGVIGTVQPDVVGLQEVGGNEPLLDLQRALGESYPHRAISEFPDRRGIRGAFLSALPITATTDFVDFPAGPALNIHGITESGGERPITRMGRGVLRIQVVKEGIAVDLMTAHLKSKLLSYPRPGGRTSFAPGDEWERAQVAGIALMQRSAEAITLRIRANEYLEGNAGVRLVVMGDLNDVPEAQTTLLLHGPSGSEIGTGGFDRSDQGDDARLFNLAPCIPEARRYSRISYGRKELIDHLLVSEELLPVGANGKRRLPQVDALVDFAATDLPSVSDDPTTRISDVAPDHAPVVATFEL